MNEAAGMYHTIVRILSPTLMVALYVYVSARAYTPLRSAIQQATFKMGSSNVIAALGSSIRGLQAAMA
jgi:hypothetical protein